MKWKIVCTLFLISIGVITILVCPSAAGAQGGATLSIVPSNQQVNPGENFNISIVIDTSVPSQGAQFAMDFDPSLVEVLSIEEGTFYSDYGNTMAFQAGQDYANGFTGVYAVVLIGASSYPQGTGTLATIHMKAKSSVFGLSDLELRPDDPPDVYCKVSDTSAQAVEPLNLVDGQVLVGTIDCGDAPDPYPNLLASNGAYHQITGPWLGNSGDSPDGEGDGQPNATATGDDNDGNDDEDGVQFTTLYLGLPMEISVQVNGGGGFVNAWIDYNGDGDWLDPDEQIHNGWLANGSHVITGTVPASATLGQTFARFRISTSGGLSPEGPADDGEVEDHVVSIESTQPDLIIKEKVEVWVIRDELYNIYYTIENAGMGTAGANHTCIYVDGVWKMARNCPALAPGETFSETVGFFDFTPPADTVLLCSDNFDVVSESDETNNCLENQWGGLPDLKVTQKMEEGSTLDTYNITYTITNTGSSPASACSVDIDIDGNPAMSASCPVLMAGESFTNTVGPYTLTGDSDAINICVDSTEIVQESNEANNCLENIYSPYIAEDINNDGIVNILDLVRIAIRYCETGSPGWVPEDVNMDGYVDMADLIQVSNQLTNTWPWS